MNILPILAVYAFSKMAQPGKAAAKSSHGPKWPSRDSPPPQRASAAHAASRKPAASSHRFAIGERCLLLPPKSKVWPDGSKATRAVKVHVVEYSGPKYVVETVSGGHVRMTVPEKALQKERDTGAPTEAQHAPVHTTEAAHDNAPSHRDATPRKRASYGAPPPKRGNYAAPPDTHATPAHEQPPDAGAGVEQHQGIPEGVYPVASLQRILVALGWRDKGTTKGALSSDLTDGDFGPVTTANWQQSARKRGLDMTIIRIDGQHAHVDPRTYDKLLSVARQMSNGGSVVGSRRRRPVYIP